MNIVKISDLPDINEIKLTSGEISMIINSIDNTIFEGFDDVDLNLGYLEGLLAVKAELSEGEVQIKHNLLSEQIPQTLQWLSDLIILITHVDPSYDAVHETHCELYNMETYLENLRKLNKRYAEVISKAVSLQKN